MNVLEIKGLTKSFGKKAVLKELDLQVPEHSVFGFVGQNGAGKTTAMKMILGLLKSDSGEITVNGERVTFGENKTNKYIGYLPDVPEFYDFMKPIEYLTLCGRITGLSDSEINIRATELLTLVGLENENNKIGSFSRGMKQRLGIAQALINRPKLLLCDEPTSALDPKGRKEILDILASVSGQTTVLFSTHILSDVERICDRVAFLQDGKIALSGTIDEVKSTRESGKTEVEFVSAQNAQEFLRLGFNAQLLSETRVRVISENQETIFQVLKSIAENKLPIVKIEGTEPSLEELFMEVTVK